MILTFSRCNRYAGALFYLLFSNFNMTSRAKELTETPQIDSANQAQQASFSVLSKGPDLAKVLHAVGVIEDKLESLLNQTSMLRSWIEELLCRQREMVGIWAYPGVEASIFKTGLYDENQRPQVGCQLTFEEPTQSSLETPSWIGFTDCDPENLGRDEFLLAILKQAFSFLDLPSNHGTMVANTYHFTEQHFRALKSFHDHLSWRIGLRQRLLGGDKLGVLIEVARNGSPRDLYQIYGLQMGEAHQVLSQSFGVEPRTEEERQEITTFMEKVALLADHTAGKRTSPEGKERAKKY